MNGSTEQYNMNLLMHLNYKNKINFYRSFMPFSFMFYI
jgi:hypothetical protein